MKKLLIFAACLLLASSAYAESSASVFSGTNYGEQQVWIYGYNISGAAVTSNAIVILDTTAANVASGSTLGVRFTTTTTNGDARALGVTDEVIANAAVGRICVRGPHQVQIDATPPADDGGAIVVGASIGTATVAGFAAPLTNGTLTARGVVLSALTTRDSSTSAYSGKTYTVAGPQNYWVWLY